MYILLLHLLIIINISVSLFILFGGIVDSEYAKFNIYIGIPILYLLYIMPFSLIESAKHYCAEKCIANYDKYKNKSIEEVITKNSNIYILPQIHDNLFKLYKHPNFNPLDYHGILIASYIINIYLLKYIWHQF
jgi:hypothetical protein